MLPSSSKGVERTTEARKTMLSHRRTTVVPIAVLCPLVCLSVFECAYVCRAARGGARGYTAAHHTKRHTLTPHVQHSARKLQRTRRNRRAQCAGARQRRACADSFIWAGKHAAASCGTRSRERARKTHARARCIGRECAERCLQGRRPAAPRPLARDARAQRPLRRCRSRAPFPWQPCERR